MPPHVARSVTLVVVVIMIVIMPVVTIIVMIVVVIVVPTGVMPAEIDHDCRFTVAMAVPPMATGLVCNKQRRVIILLSLMLLFLRIHAAASTHRQFPAA